MIDHNQYYDNHWYSVEVPPVQTFYWHQGDWIRFISKCGKWQKPALEKRYKQALAAYKEGIYSPVDCAKQFDVSPVVMSHAVKFFHLENRKTRVDL